MTIRAMLLLSLLAGCAMTPWDQAANDARLAIEQQDFRLYQLPVRGMVLLGIEIPERAEAALRCGTRVLAGVGDTIKTPQQLQARKQRTDYATRYNQLVYQACIEQK